MYVHKYIEREFTVEHQLIPIVWDYGRYVNIYMCVYYQLLIPYNWGSPPRRKPPKNAEDHSGFITIKQESYQ